MSRQQVLKLYKQLLRKSGQFPSYNFRQYALRKVRDSFKENRDLNDTNQIMEKIAEGSKNLAIITRQVAIGEMYRTDKLVIENVAKTEAKN